MPDLYLLNGCNIGDKTENLSNALIFLREVFNEPLAVSNIYETQPWGKENQANFYNQALKFETIMAPEQILKQVKLIEKKIGGDHIERWAARKMDIDIIFFGELIYKSESLCIPHKLMHLRNFVLHPLYEIAADKVHPQFELTVKELLENSTDELKVVKLEKLNEI